MVIHTEYRGQRYSMGSSDPLPGRVRNPVREPELPDHGEQLPQTNRDELRARRQTEPGPVPAPPAADAPGPARVDVAGPSAPRHCRRSGQCPR
jgi:hypothetical protein